MRVITRRQMLHSGVKLAATAAGASIWPISQASAQLSEAQPFDFAILRKTARELAAKSYVAPKNPAADIIAKIDFDVAQKIKFRAENALWGEGPGLYPVRLFHVDKFNPLPVQLNMLSGGMARRVLYSQQAFDYGDSEIGHKLPSDLGFSGFRVMDEAFVDDEGCLRHCRIPLNAATRHSRAHDRDGAPGRRGPPGGGGCQGRKTGS